jgi:hypothetical protein
MKDEDKHTSLLVTEGKSFKASVTRLKVPLSYHCCYCDDEAFAPPKSNLKMSQSFCRNNKNFTTVINNCYRFYPSLKFAGKASQLIEIHRDSPQG